MNLIILLRYSIFLKLVLSGDTIKVSDNQLNAYVDLLVNKYRDDLSIRALHSDFLKKENKIE